MLSLLFGFRGRFNLTKYWLTVFFCFIVEFAAIEWIDVFGSGEETIPGYAGLSKQVAGMIMLVAIVPLFAAGTKRLHDRDKSGLWLLVFYIAPVVLPGMVVTYYVRHCPTPIWEPCPWVNTTGAFGIVCEFLALAIGIWAFLELGCFRGAVGPNRYGPDPLA